MLILADLTSQCCWPLTALLTLFITREQALAKYIRSMLAVNRNSYPRVVFPLSVATSQGKKRQVILRQKTYVRIVFTK